MFTTNNWRFRKLLRNCNMKSYYHFSSKGLESEVLFASEQEFIAGMNRIGVCWILCKREYREVQIIAFCLMDNHWHFILYGRLSDCYRFARRYKKLTSMWITEHRGTPLLEKQEIGHWVISREKLADKIAYVLRNPVAAGMGLQPAAYRWSSASLMFSGNSAPVFGKRDTQSLAMKEKRRLAYTRQILPDNWIVGPDNLIWPGNYVEYKHAERVFGSLGKFMFSINNSNIDKETELEMMDGSVSLPDGEIRIKAVALCEQQFFKKSIEDCSVLERVAVARTLKNNFFCRAKQLARILHLNPDELKLII